MGLVGWLRGFLRGAGGTEPIHHRRRQTQVQFLDLEDPLEKGGQPTPVFLPGESHGQRRMPGYSPWDGKESDMTEGT